MVLGVVVGVAEETGGAQGSVKRRGLDVLLEWGLGRGNGGRRVVQCQLQLFSSTKGELRQWQGGLLHRASSLMRHYQSQRGRKMCRWLMQRDLPQGEAGAIQLL